MLTRRETVEKKWDRQIAQLAGVTEAIGNSDPEAITSGGFGVRGAAPKPKPLAAPKALRALTNGRPGMTKLTWEVLDGAAIFLVEMSLDAGSPVNWQRMTTSTKTSCEIDGAEPGKPAWFRVAAVNPAGQGPWSAEALRQVM